MRTVTLTEPESTGAYAAGQEDRPRALVVARLRERLEAVDVTLLPRAGEPISMAAGPREPPSRERRRADSDEAAARGSDGCWRLGARGGKKNAQQTTQRADRHVHPVEVVAPQHDLAVADVEAPAHPDLEAKPA
jgi:hypothetical protein